MLLKLLNFESLLLDQLVFRVELSFVLETLLFKELDPAVLLEEFLLHTRHLLEQFIVLLLLVHDSVRAFGMTLRIGLRSDASSFHF